jgi:hypothetical protein
MIVELYSRWKAKIYDHAALTVFGVAVVVRMVNLLFVDDVEAFVFAEDSSIYWQGAKAWLDAGYFARADGVGFVPETERVPLYHLFLVPFRWAFGEELIPILIGQILIDSCTCVFIVKICREVNERTVLIAGISAALWPNLILHSQMIFGDSLFVFLFTVFLFLAIHENGPLADFVLRGRRLRLCDYDALHRFVHPILGSDRRSLRDVASLRKLAAGNRRGCRDDFRGSACIVPVAVAKRHSVRNASADESEWSALSLLGGRIRSRSRGKKTI